MSDELKIVIVLKGERGSVGIQAPECDPVFAIIEGGLDTALGRVPEMVAEAKHRWEETPRYPKCTSPLPSQQATPRAPQTPRTQARQTPAPAPQQKLF